MPACKNDKTRSYKGNEPSPKGLGYCAHAMSVGTEKKGSDGNIWVVKKTNSGQKRWVKCVVKPSKTLLKLKNKNLKKKLKNIGIDIFVINWYPVNGYYIFDYLWDIVSEKYGKGFDYLDYSFIIVPVKANDTNKEIYLQHNKLTYNKKKQVVEILKEEFGSDYKWSGKTRDAIEIKLR